MTHDDPDLAAVRAAFSPRTSGTASSLARSWAVIAARRSAADPAWIIDGPDPAGSAAGSALGPAGAGAAGPGGAGPGGPRGPGPGPGPGRGPGRWWNRPRGPARWLLPAGAAASVAALAVGVAAVVGPAGGVGLDLPAEPPPTTDGAGEHTGVPALAPSSAEAVAALHALGDAAERTEVATLADGQLLYHRSDGWAATFGRCCDAWTGEIRRQLVESWSEPAGLVSLRTVRLDGDDERVEDRRGWSDRDWEERTGHGPPSQWEPGPHQPTPDWLAGLPTDPAALLAELRSVTHPRGSPSADDQVWEAASGLYRRAEIFLTPQLRAALPRALSELDGLTTSRVEVDGRELVGVAQVDTRHSRADQLLFDPATGRAVGQRSLSFDERLRLIQPEDGPELDPGVSSQSLWTFTFVDEVGDTG